MKITPTQINFNGVESRISNSYRLRLRSLGASGRPPALDSDPRRYMNPFASRSRRPSGFIRKRRKERAACGFLLDFTTPPDWRIGLWRFAGTRTPPRWTTRDHAVR